FAQLRLFTPEDFWYTSFDGRKIETWIMKPVGFTPGRKYPLILNIHGGPHTAYGYIFFHEMQWLAARGYVVLYPNPRGSTTYGQEFGNIIQYRYPGDDYRDLMIAVDSLIRRGYVDSTRLGVTGGSGGGLLTDWAVEHTHGFGAAVFRALKYLRKTTVMVRFPGESHELSRSGKPVHRVERLQHIVSWFDKYLQGKPITAYDAR